MNNQKRILLALLISIATATTITFLGSLKIPSTVEATIDPIITNITRRTGYPGIQLKNKFEEVPAVPSGTFNYGGATSFFSIFREGFGKEIEKAHPQFKINLDPSAIGTSEGISRLISGKLSFAHSDRPLTEAELKTSKDKGLRLEVIPVALDGIAVYVNPSTQIKSLTVANLQDIYGGKVTNWQELGGASLAIVPISLDPSVDSGISLWKSNSDNVSNNVLSYEQTHTAAIAKTASTSGAIGYGSAAIVAGQESVNPVAISFNNNNISIPSSKADNSANTQAFAKNIYPLTRRLYVVVPRDGSVREKAAIAYANLLFSNVGRKLIEKAGLVPIY